MIMFYLKKSDENGEFYGTIWKNGREIWRTSETYKRRRSVLRAFEIVAEAFGTTWNEDYMDESRYALSSLD